MRQSAIRLLSIEPTRLSAGHSVFVLALVLGCSYFSQRCEHEKSFTASFSDEGLTKKHMWLQ
jgi:hypothetical protein